MRLFIIILMLSGCGSSLLESGTYTVKAKVVHSDWGLEVGSERGESQWVIEKQDFYTMRRVDADWEFIGQVEEGLIVLNYHQEMDSSVDDCYGYNQINLILTPNADGISFVGDWQSDLHMCNLGCPFPTPECEPKEVNIYEHLTLTGVCGNDVTYVPDGEEE